MPYCAARASHGKLRLRCAQCTCIAYLVRPPACRRRPEQSHRPRTRRSFFLGPLGETILVYNARVNVVSSDQYCKVRGALGARPLPRPLHSRARRRDRGVSHARASSHHSRARTAMDGRVRLLSGRAHQFPNPRHRRQTTPASVLFHGGQAHARPGPRGPQPAPTPPVVDAHGDGAGAHDYVWVCTHARARARGIRQQARAPAPARRAVQRRALAPRAHLRPLAPSRADLGACGPDTRCSR